MQQVAAPALLPGVLAQTATQGPETYATTPVIVWMKPMRRDEKNQSRDKSFNICW